MPSESQCNVVANVLVAITWLAGIAACTYLASRDYVITGVIVLVIAMSASHRSIRR